MTNKNAEAFPVDGEQNLHGLTKREYAAIHILAGLVGNHLRESAVKDVSRAMRDETVDLAVELADRLLDTL